VFYREVGEFKESYAADQAIFPIAQDRFAMAIMLVIAYVAIPLFGSEFLISSIMIPFLILGLASVGLNILTGYSGLLSLGTAAFMGVGAYACYKLSTIFPAINIIVWIVSSGFISSAVGVCFGLPSLRIKGFYLVVATLAAQFFLQWCFVRISWLCNDNPSGAIEVPSHTFFSVFVTGPSATPIARYILVLTIVTVLTLAAANLLHGRIGRSFMAVRDMDIAAELIGIRLLPTKLLAFAVSSFYVGVAGAMMVFLWLGAAEPEAFNIDLSFRLLFMVIVGGLGSLMGAFFGAALLQVLPIVLRLLPISLGLTIGPATVEHLTLMVTGALIILFLVWEPHGLARLWQIGKVKLRMWPFPH
jgi:branched-chain amino acid transport system permease protein